MSAGQEQKYSIRELVEVSGVPRRTVRYYVQRGLLPPPEGAGRGHFYRASHLERLLFIKDLQGKGLGLAEIGVRLEGPLEEEWVPSPPLPEFELTTRIHIADGVEILVSHGRQPPRPAELRALAEAATRILKRGEI